MRFLKAAPLFFAFAATPVFGQAFTGPTTITQPTTPNDCVKIGPSGSNNLVDAGAPCASGSAPIGANPTATIGAAVINGNATTFMRSDAAPALPATLPALSGVNLTALNATQLTSGTVPAARLPNPTTTTLGGTQSTAVVANNFLTGISTSGVPSQARPTCAYLSDAGSGCSGAASATGANPTGTITGPAANGSAVTFMRSDAVLMLGTITQQAAVNLNTGSCPASIAGAWLNGCAADGVTARVQNNSFGAIAAFTSMRADGTAASPTGLVANDQIGGYNSYGRDSTGATDGPAASVRCYATETWSATANGTKCAIATTANTTATLSDKLVIDGNGHLTMEGVTSTGATGTGAIVFGIAPTITLANGTGLPVSTGISGLGTGIATFLATPSSANLAAAVTDETGGGAAVFAASPSLSGTITVANGNVLLNPGSTAAEQYNLSGRTGLGYPVTFLTPTTNTTKMVLDIFPKGAPSNLNVNTGNQWLDMCSTDIIADSTNFECMNFSKFAGGAGNIVVRAAGTGTFYGLNLQSGTSIGTKGVCIRCSSASTSVADILRLSGAPPVSTSALLFDGTIQAGGTGTTGFPAVFLQPSGTTAVTTYSTAGTGLGMNLASGFAGNFLDFHVAGGAGLFKVASDGSFTSAAFISGGSVPTLTGTCTTGSQAGGNTSGTFAATCVSQTIIITFATTAPTGWNCNAHDRTTPADALNQTASSATSCTLTGTTVATDVVSFDARAY